jgi:hypothetical protein
MNAYERERAECAADEEARADRRLRAWRRRQASVDAARPCGSYGTPEFIILDFSPMTNTTTVTQIANALSTGGGVAGASNVVLISQ